MAHINRHTFACLPDADAALSRFKKEHENEFFPLDGSVQAVEVPIKRGVRGRPPNGFEPEYKTVFQTNLKVLDLDPVAFRKAKERLSCFVLITSIMDRNLYSGAGILVEYKNQTSIELAFKTIKAPEFVGAMYLKRPDRLEALAYVVLMAVLIKNLFERRVRRKLKTEDAPLVLPGKKKSWNPTGDKILDCFENLDIVLLDSGHRQFSSTRLPERLFTLTGLDPAIYLKPRESP